MEHPGAFLARMKQAETGEIREPQWACIGLGSSFSYVPKGICTDIAELLGIGCGADTE
jgi:hypothetical protein